MSGWIIIAHADVAEQVGRVLFQDLAEGDGSHVLVVGMEPGALRPANVGCVMTESEFCAAMASDSEQAIARVRSLCHVSNRFILSGLETYIRVHHIWSDIKGFRILDELGILVCSWFAVRGIVDAEALQVKGEDRGRV